MQTINWILRFAGLLFLLMFQVLVLNKLNINTYIHPYVYPMFLLLLPFAMPRWATLPLGFIVGLLVDMFNNTPGMHAAACVLMVFVQPRIVKFFTPITGYENVESPSISQLGLIWFTLFTVCNILIHHTMYYLLQVFWLKDIGFLVLKILFSTLVSTALIIILAFLFAQRKKRI